MKYSLLQLAYLGDSIYEIYVRRYLLEKNIVKLKNLQTESLKYVPAKRQAYFLNELSNGFLKDDELDLVRRGRNVKTNSKPKSCDVVTYRYATALEVLFGYYYSLGNVKRLDEIFEKIIKM